MGRRGRARGSLPRLAVPESGYRNADGDELVLRGALSPQTRRAYAAIVHDQARSTEDSWHRGVEFLFERLAMRWVVAGVPAEGQRELLARFRVAGQDERRWIRDALREHLAEHFPDMEAP